jgi:carbamoyl-phosphate synthase small subunit
VSDAGVPVFGICLGCQLVARAFGGRTYKLPYGHRGGNHPVRNLETGAVEITSQNHGFAIAEENGFAEGTDSLRVTHRNLNDGTVEGLSHASRPVFAVQYHPEAAPGPHDSRYLFWRFIEAMGATPTVATG